MFGSQYVHSYSFSLSQLLSDENGEGSIDEMQKAGIFTVNMLLALTIDTFWKVYPLSMESLVPPDQATMELVAFLVWLHGRDPRDEVNRD